MIIRPKDNEKGKIEIEYYTASDFERIVEQLAGTRGHSGKKTRKLKLIFHF